MKQNIEFYPHYAFADQHAKFKMLRVEFGWEGEGKFWALNNRIALAEGCCLDITKKYNKAALANDLDFTLAKLDEFILFLKDDCELIKKCEDGFITTDVIQEVFAKVTQERSKARERHRRASGEKVETSGEKIHRVKESKGKDINKCPQQIILNLYHDILPECIKHIKWDGQRAVNLKARWGEEYISDSSGFKSSQPEYWQELFKYIRTSDFLMGKKEWQGFSLEWLVKKANFLKVVEGKYANKE